MIAFFRRFRQRLLSENKFSKYLIYAIGEIILVVIGILIALQINNWNENKKVENKINQTLADLEKDLIYNHKEATRILKFYYQIDSLTKLGIYKKLKKEDYYNNNFLDYITTNWDQLRPKTSNITKLIDYEKDAKKEHKAIIEIAKLLRDQKVDLDSNWELVTKGVNNEVEYLSQYLFISAKDSITRAAKIDFFLNNPEYEKRLNKSWVINQVYYDNVSRYMAINLATLLQIKRLDNNFDTTKMNQLLANYGMKSFRKVNCSKPPITSSQYRKHRASHLLVNTTKDSVVLNLYFDKKVTYQHVLAPYQIVRSHSYFVGLDGNQNVLLEQLDKSGNCINKFRAVQNGYLVID